MHPLVALNTGWNLVVLAALLAMDGTPGSLCGTPLSAVSILLACHGLYRLGRERALPRPLLLAWALPLVVLHPVASGLIAVDQTWYMLPTALSGCAVLYVVVFPLLQIALLIVLNAALRGRALPLHAVRSQPA